MKLSSKIVTGLAILGLAGPALASTGSVAQTRPAKLQMKRHARKGEVKVAAKDAGKKEAKTAKKTAHKKVEKKVEKKTEQKTEGAAPAAAPAQ